MTELYFPLLKSPALQMPMAPTFLEAQAQVQAREEDRRKAALRKDKHKQRSSKTKDTPKEDTKFPGAVPGAETNTTALWLATEVRHLPFLFASLSSPPGSLIPPAPHSKFQQSSHCPALLRDWLKVAESPYQMWGKSFVLTNGLMLCPRSTG